MVIVHLSVLGHLVGHQSSMNIFWIVLRYAVSSQDRGRVVEWPSPGMKFRYGVPCEESQDRGEVVECLSPGMKFRYGVPCEASQDRGGVVKWLSPGTMRIISTAHH